jgi:hypothetical protein
MKKQFEVHATGAFAVLVMAYLALSGIYFLAKLF